MLKFSQFHAMESWVLLERVAYDHRKNELDRPGSHRIHTGLSGLGYGFKMGQVAGKAVRAHGERHMFVFPLGAALEIQLECAEGPGEPSNVRSFLLVEQKAIVGTVPLKDPITAAESESEASISQVTGSPKRSG